MVALHASREGKRNPKWEEKASVDKKTYEKRKEEEKQTSRLEGGRKLQHPTD